jgi:hypothetical protein
VPGDVSGGNRGSFLFGSGRFGLRRLLGWHLRRLDRRGLRQDFAKELVARAGPLSLRDFCVTIRVLAVTSLADDLHDRALHQACYVVIQEETAARTIIIYQIAQARNGFKHGRFLGGSSSCGIPRLPLDPAYAGFVALGLRPCSASPSEVEGSEVEGAGRDSGDYIPLLSKIKLDPK